MGGGEADPGANANGSSWHSVLLGGRSFLALVLLVVGIGGAYTIGSRLSGSEANARRASDARVGYYAPDVALPDMNGQTVSLDTYRGQVVLLNLWASWCGPCRTEMPGIEQVYRRYRAQGFMVLAVNATSDDTETDARSMVQTMALTFPVLFDRNGVVATAYRLRTMPTSYFIDRSGVIQEIVIGSMTEAMLEARVKRLLEAGR